MRFFAGSGPEARWCVQGDPRLWSNLHRSEAQRGNLPSPARRPYKRQTWKRMWQSVICGQSFFKIGPIPASLFIFVLFKHNITEKTEGYSGIQTRIDGVEGEHADHLFQTGPMTSCLIFFTFKTVFVIRNSSKNCLTRDLKSSLKLRFVKSFELNKDSNFKTFTKLIKMFSSEEIELKMI